MRWRIGVLFLLLSVSPLVLAEADTIQTDDHITASVGYVIPTGVVIDFFLFNTTGDQTLAYWDNYVLDLYEEINFLFQNSDIPVFFDVEHIMVFQDQTENEAAFDYIDIPNNEIDVIELLSSFSSFVDGNSTLSGYEEIQLLSGSDFTNNTAGLAWLADPTQTTKFSSFYPRSVVQATFPFDVVAKIAAHEIAHNYSATHDGQGDNSCNQSAFIMSPFISSQTTFSSCSIDELSTYLEKSWFDTYEDTTTPILTDITDFDVAQEIGQFLPLIWDVTDDHPGYYTLSIDDLVVVDNERINGSTIEYLISLDLAGNYSIELNITDLVGHHASDTFTLEIGGDLTPRIYEDNGVPSILENSSLTLTWNITDDGNISQITLFQDGVIVNTTSIVPPTLYNYTISGLTAGIYNFTLQIMDEINQTAISTVMLEVIEPVTTSTQDTSTETVTSSTTSVVETTSTSSEVIIETITRSQTQSGNALDNLLSFNILGITVFAIGVPALVRRHRR